MIIAIAAIFLIIWWVYINTRPKVGRFEENLNKLEFEYRRYTYVTRILDRVSSLGDKYETRNIVERWLLSMVNFSDDKFDEVFSNDVLSKECRFNTQMVYELAEKTKAPAETIESVIDVVIDIVSEYKTIRATPCKDSKYTLKNGVFRYKEYTRKIAKNRITLLLSRGTSYDIAVMLMRYASILPGAQHWNMPKTNYQLYYNDGIRIEGFASPINAQLITIDPKCSFCSLFPDVDYIFGSIGNFFTTTFIGKKVAVGPPYTVELFEKIANKVNKECEAAQAQNSFVLFYITFSAWEDTAGYNMIKESPFCTFAGILPARDHYYVNTNTPEEPPVTATFRTVFFAMGYPTPQATNYDYLFKGMTKNPQMKLEVKRSLKN